MMERLFERRLQARYDAAQTTADNRNHWSAADGLSARAANSPGVRQTLRMRSRYEVENNSYAAGMLLTLANDTIGTGPRLRVHVPSLVPRGNDKAASLRRQQLQTASNYVESEFRKWSKAVKLPQKLRTMRIARAKDGEAFAILTTNPKLNTPVKLDLKLVEADQVASLDLTPTDPTAVDGIRFDDDMNPVEYDVLKHHPGDDLFSPNYQPEAIKAEHVIHWFRSTRPGQLRGIPEITPALPLYAMLRRFTLAVIAAAETAADFAAVLSSNVPGEEGDSPEAFTELDIVHRMMLQLPANTTLTQLRAEQPTTTYEMFKRNILAEIARCLNMPYNVAAGDSSGYNYSSGRLDHQLYRGAINIDRSDCEDEVLARIFEAWLAEAELIHGYLPAELGSTSGYRYAWSWDPATDIDPTKTANARQINLASGMTSHQDEFDELGMDGDIVHMRAAEFFGCSLEEYRALLRRKLLGDAAPIPAVTEQQSFAAKTKRQARKANARQRATRKGV